MTMAMPPVLLDSTASGQCTTFEESMGSPEEWRPGDPLVIDCSLTDVITGDRQARRQGQRQYTSKSVAAYDSDDEGPQTDIKPGRALSLPLSAPNSPTGYSPSKRRFGSLLGTGSTAVVVLHTRDEDQKELVSRVKSVFRTHHDSNRIHGS